MNLRYKLHNALIHRGLLPPPISSCKVNNKSIGLADPPLLHQACAFCGRVFMYLFLLLLPLGFSSCEQPRLHYAELEAYYAESQQLSAAPRDSIVRFSRKVQGFVTRNPDATEDPLYPKIKSNISLSLRLTDSSWGEDRTITFGGDTTGGNTSQTDSGTVTYGNVVIDTVWAGHNTVSF